MPTMGQTSSRNDGATLRIIKMTSFTIKGRKLLVKDVTYLLLNMMYVDEVVGYTECVEEKLFNNLPLACPH